MFLDSSPLIKGYQIQLDIKNSTFKNIINRAPNPIIIDLNKSNSTFFDVAFKNIT